jgi:ABC-2 type transport system ATP-binding protein
MSVPAPVPPAIEVSGLVKSYSGHTAVHHLGFTVARGEIVGFLGPNGAGKSTTMRILTGYMPATAGRVRVCGVDVAAEPERVKNLIGYMPENNPLPEDMRVSEYLDFRGRLKGVPRRKLGPRLDEVVELCDLGRVRHRLIGKLSKGYRQRVGIADAILAEPPLIIMDEPTIGLDPHQILGVRDLIAGLRGRMTVLISSHILPEIEVTCDRVLILAQGRLVAQGTAAELRREFFGGGHYALQVAGDLTGLSAVLANVHAGLTLAEPANAGENPEAFATNFRAVRIAATPEAPELGEALLAALAARPGLRVRSLERVRPSLEDVFLAATTQKAATVAPLGRPPRR